jgi:hypothetical protein
MKEPTTVLYRGCFGGSKAPKSIVYHAFECYFIGPSYVAYSMKMLPHTSLEG